jgi:tetratricopeptide (TPR) repeat protein
MSKTLHTHIIDHTRQSVAIIAAISLALVFLILVVQPTCVAAESDDAVQFNLGQIHYAAGDYDAAITSFSRAVSLAPDNSSYHHWLGKSYGMRAQESNLLMAYALSKKTRLELEQAVALDDRNVDALTDLMEYYRRAPAFLGGGEEKADKIRIHLDELKVIKDANQGPDAEKS